MYVSFTIHLPPTAIFAFCSWQFCHTSPIHTLSCVSFCVWEFSRSPPNSFHFYYVSMTVLPHTSVIRAIIKCQFRNIIPTQILSTQNWISPIPSICALCALYFHHTKSNFLKVYFWIIVLQGSHSILSFPYFLSPTLKSCIVYTVKWGGTLSSSFSKISFNSLFC